MTSFVNAAVAGVNFGVKVFNNKFTETCCQTGEFKNYEEFLKNETPAIELINPEQGTYKLLCAPMQSGKTSILINSAFIRAIEGFNVFIFTRNIKMDKNQLVNRLIEKQCELKLKFDFPSIDIISSIDMSVCSKLKEKCKYGSIFVLLGNVNDYKKINNYVCTLSDKKTPIRKCIMMIDEIDVNIKGDTTNLKNCLLNNEHWNVVMRVGVSATMMGLFTLIIS